MSQQSALYGIADELRAIANMGRQYSQNEYDTERYRRVSEISARLIHALDGEPFEERIHEPPLNDWSHVSPAAGAEAMVVRDGKALLIRRTDDNLWCIPGGLVDVGETLAEAALRELWEEAGLRGQTVRLLGVFDSRLWQSRSRMQFFGAVFLVDAGFAAPVAGPEATETGFFGENELPPLSPGHDLRVPLLFRRLREENAAAFYDKPGGHPGVPL